MGSRWRVLSRAGTWSHPRQRACRTGADVSGLSLVTRPPAGDPRRPDGGPPIPPPWPAGFFSLPRSFFGREDAGLLPGVAGTCLYYEPVSKRSENLPTGCYAACSLRLAAVGVLTPWGVAGTTGRGLSPQTGCSACQPLLARGAQSPWAGVLGVGAAACFHRQAPVYLLCGARAQGM